MFVMISAILLAWAPTAAYAGEPGFLITTIDRKGNTDLNEQVCVDILDEFFIDIRGKGGDYQLDGGGAVPIPKFTGTI